MPYQQDQVNRFKAMAEGKTSQQLQTIQQSSAATLLKGTPENQRMKQDIWNYAREAEGYFNADHQAQGEMNKQQVSMSNAHDEYNASFLDKMSAIGKAAYGTSAPAQALNKLAISSLSSGEADPSFLKQNDFNFREQSLNAEGLQANSYNLELLSSAKNKADFNFYMQTMHTDQAFSDNSRFLTDGQNKFAAVAGVLSDPTYLVYAPAKIFMGLLGGVRLAAVVGTNSALQYGLSKARDYGMPSRTIDDTMLDTAFGGVVDSFFAMKALGKMTEHDAVNIGAAHAEAKDMLAGGP